MMSSRNEDLDSFKEELLTRYFSETSEGEKIIRKVVKTLTFRKRNDLFLEKNTSMEKYV